MTTKGSITRQCTKCGVLKPLEEFYKKATGKDGLQAHCKRCQCDYVLQWQRNHPERRREWTNRWRKNNAERHRANSREHAKLRRERDTERARLLSRVQEFARCHVNMPRVCAVCQTTERVQFHHPDYSKRLSVIPLCPVHHAAAHSPILLPVAVPMEVT